MLFRSYILTSDRNLTKFTIDCQTSTGYDEAGAYGSAPKAPASLRLVTPQKQKQFGLKKLKKWLAEIEYPYLP